MSEVPLPAEPGFNCELCPRLVAYRTDNRKLKPDWFNGPVQSFGKLNAQLLIVGLAPGLKGANMTGRPFTGDHAGNLLYDTLEKYNFSKGKYLADLNDGLTLVNCRITNAVKCVPPKNKPTASEITECRIFLESEIKAMRNLRVILALGRISHDSIVSALGLKRSKWPFRHGLHHRLPTGIILVDSYHCSRYNTNTRRLTIRMFCEVFESLHNIFAD